MLKPLHFEVEKDGTYRMCVCKATRNRPLCDGRHFLVTILLVVQVAQWILGS